MPYIEKIVIAGRTIEIQRYYSHRIHPKGCKRQKKQKKTTESQKRINVRKAIDKLRWLLNENFTGGDMHIRLSYAGTKPDYDQMKEDKAKFLEQSLKSRRKN